LELPNHQPKQSYLFIVFQKRKEKKKEKRKRIPFQIECILAKVKFLISIQTK